MANSNELKVSGHVQELVANPSPLGLLVWLSSLW